MNKEVLKKLNILYVEDEKDVREFTSNTINNIVNKMIIASNGKEGLEKFAQNPDINLILTDINLPKMDGLEMCEIIRKDNSDIPIIITSAHSDPSFLKKAIDIKVSAYAMKPIDLYSLIESMIKAIEPIFLKNELENINLRLKNKVEEVKKQTKSILDAQSNIVILANSNEILEVNKKFLEFFGVNSLNNFTEERGSILDTFKTDIGLFSKKSLKEDENWILKLEQLNEVNRVVKIETIDKQDRLFIISIDKYSSTEKNYIISFTDITKLKEKSSLLDYQANYDQLTGLFNKGKFNEIFIKEIKREKRYKNSLSIILFKIDDFNNFCENYGKSKGDEILKVVADIVINRIREQDTVTRWSTEDFLILLPQTNIEGAKYVAEKIRTALETFPLETIPCQITASFGISDLKDEDNHLTILNKTKDILNKAKNKGKNQILVT